MSAIEKLFIVSDKWWICSNEGRIDMDNELLKDIDGRPLMVKQRTVLVSIDSFLQGEKPRIDDKVDCMYDLDGLKLCFKGSVNSFNGTTCVLNITSEHTDKGIKEICNKINTNNYI